MSNEVTDPKRWDRAATFTIVLLEALLIGLQLAFLASTRLDQPTILLDDAYIHFKYALNWGAGQGWTFNFGERVLGTTSPVWTYFLGTAHALTEAEIPRVATVLNFGFDAVTMLVVVHLLRALGVTLLLRHGIALAMHAEPLATLYSVGGMEMSLFVMVVVLALEGLRGERAWMVGGALAVAGFVRPEGAVLWAACMGGLCAGRRWNFALRSLGIAAIGALCVGLLVYISFGSVIPQSLIAKANAPWFLKGGGICHTQFFAELANLVPTNALSGFQGIWATPSDRFNTAIVSLCQITLMGFGVWWMWNSGARVAGATAGLFALGYYAFYALANPAIYPWYYVPYYSVGLLLGGVGAWQALKWMMERFWGKDHRGLPRNSLVGAMALAWLLMAIFNAAHRGSARIYVGETGRESLHFRLRGAVEGEREVDYLHVTKRMNAWMQNNRPMSVGCMEIGIFGYAFKGHVLDSYGLVSPEALRVADPEVEGLLPESCRRHPINVFMTERPEFVMVAGFMFPKPPREFLEQYIQLGVPERTLKVFVRRDVVNEPWGFPLGNTRDILPKDAEDNVW